MRARGERRRRHRLVQRVRRQDFDQVKVAAQESLEVARREGAGMFGRPAREDVGVGVAQGRNLRLGVIEVAAHIKIEYAPKADKSHP